jgi:hypothetical protein
MTDNVIQSFCERCGARFTQPAPVERPAPPAGMLGRFRRRNPDLEGTPADGSALPISDAFKDTFHFCLGCRRYNCPECWNEQAGHCLSCRPLDGPAVADPVPADARTLTPGAGAGSAADPQPISEPTRWPTGDLGARAPATTAGSDLAPAVDRSMWAAPIAGVSSAMSPPPVVGPPAEPAVRADPTPAAASDLPWTPTPEIDPWRGVVFSADEQGRSQTVVAPEPIEDVGVLASLMDTDTHVDASGWARASAVVMGGVGASAGLQPEDAGSSTSDDAVESVTDEGLAPSAPVVVAASDAVEPPEAVAEPVESVAEPPVAEPPVAEAEPPVAAAPDDEPMRPDDTPLAPVPETEAWLDIARRGLDDTPPDLHDAASPTVPGLVAVHAIDEEMQPAPELPLAPEVPPAPELPLAEADTVAAIASTMPQSAPDTATPTGPPQVEPSTPPPPPPLTPIPATPALPTSPPVPPVPPRQVAPTVPSPGLEVWATPVDTGPFAQPYQPPAPQAVVVMPSVPPVAPSGAPPATVPVAMAAPPVVPGASAVPMPPPGGPLPPPSPPSPRAAMPAPAVVPAGLPAAARQAAASKACPSCGLPLSTKARFCRRCGAPQSA